MGGGGGAQAFRKSLGMSSDNHSGINWDVTSGGSPIWQYWQQLASLFQEGTRPAKGEYSELNSVTHTVVGAFLMSRSVEVDVVVVVVQSPHITR